MPPGSPSLAGCLDKGEPGDSRAGSPSQGYSVGCLKVDGVPKGVSKGFKRTRRGSSTPEGTEDGAGGHGRQKPAEVKGKARCPQGGAGTGPRPRVRPWLLAGALGIVMAMSRAPGCPGFHRELWEPLRL